ncbi:MAG: NAD-dependent epimerase/dehydratase family protein [Deltaproteobacteria bacterium]
MKILVTGGAGFIGSWVADSYLGEGHDVLVLDDLSSGIIENVPEKADFIKGDIREREVIDRAIAAFKPDIVNHHAAQIDVRKSVEDPVFDASVNILGTLNLIESSLKHGVKRFVFASTGGAIYGEPEDIPADEKTPPMPISAYGTSKYAVEKYLEYYKSIYSLDYVALRYANVYGPRQNPHGEAGVVAIFCSRILSGEPCKIFGDGGQTRDYVFAGDVARASLKALGAPSGSYNIGTGIETSVTELVKELELASGTDVKVEHAEERAGEVRRISLDAELAGKVLGWKPEIQLSEGIKKTWEWFRESPES